MVSALLLVLVLWCAVIVDAAAVPATAPRGAVAGCSIGIEKSEGQLEAPRAPSASLLAPYMLLLLPLIIKGMIKGMIKASSMGMR